MSHYTTGPGLSLHFSRFRVKVERACVCVGANIATGGCTKNIPTGVCAENIPTLGKIISTPPAATTAATTATTTAATTAATTGGC